MRAVLAAVAALLVLPAAAHAQLSALRACDEAPGFRCATLTVPLDRTGTDPGSLRLRVAVQEGFRRGRDRLVLGLTGGPGQAGVPFATSFAVTLAPLLERGERLAVIDQRGTAGGALRCDALQRLRGLDSFEPAAVGACGAQLGARGRHLSTADAVADLEALRAALGAAKVTLFGVSYGTHVAQQFARTHPRRVRRLLLDSVLEPGGWDGFLLKPFGALPRVLRALCPRRTCPTDPVADLAAVVQRQQAGPLAARVPDARGRVQAAALRTTEELFFLLLASDLNAPLQAALPAALRAAARGDLAPLVRLRAPAQGTRLAARDLSAAVLVATDCADAALPYELSEPPAQRQARLDAALRAIPPAAYAPFDLEAVRRASLADDCLAWPQQPDAPAADGPMPDVPALLLAGTRDVRTPLESARAAAAALPRARLVTVPGTGHDVLGQGGLCPSTALERWLRGRRPRRCADPEPRAAAGLPATLPQTPAGLRGAVRATVRDASLALAQRAAAGLPARTGGLRAGRAFVGEDGERERLRGYEAVPGLRLTGSTDVLGAGRFRVSGAVAGRVRIDDDGRVTGRLTRSSRTAR